MAKTPPSLFSSSTVAYEADRRALLKKWAADPNEFLEGVDVDGAPLIITQDEQDDVKAFKPFPTDLPHTRLLTLELLRPVRYPTEAEVSLVDKSRRMMVSTQAMLLGLHHVLFKSGRKVLVSKQTQELAEILLEDKVRSTYRRMPEWFQQVLPLSMEPKSVAKARVTGSEIICVSQNAGVRHFRGNAASILIIDEAAVQEFFEQMMQAANSMSQRIWAVTTAFHGNPGAEEFDRLRQEPTEAGGAVVEDCVHPELGVGFTARTTEKGYRVITLDAWANPHRGKAWLERARLRASTEADFQREVMRNWNITSGKVVYPEFAEVGRERYIYDAPKLLAGPIIRGWDFGARAPGCVWFQYAPESDRVYVLREWFPRGIAAHHFRDVCRYLSGQMRRDELIPECVEWVDLLDSLPGHPKTPWFPSGMHFEDFTNGREISNRQSIAARDPTEATLKQVWAAGGIEFSPQNGPVKARTEVLRRLLYVRPDGWPGVVIAPCCTEVLAMLDGGLTWKRATPVNPMPEEIKKDGRHDNTHDALTYGIVGVVPATGQPGVTPGMAAVEPDREVGWTL